MNSLKEYIIEKFKINSKNIINSKEKSSLWDSLDELIKSKQNNCIYDNEDIRKEYHISNMFISYNYNTKWITLDNIIISDHNMGYGTIFMKDLCEWADNNKFNICLTPSNDFGSNINRLKKFYKRFGFIENKGKHSDFTTKQKMYRYYNN